MTTHSHYPHTNQQRRAKAVYGTLRSKRPMVGLFAAELCMLGLITLAAAGFIGLRAWLTVAN
ncbi:hypothetical protein J2Y55_001014 [Bosea sp. BE125]|uniref:hypothetical protein n=1 Tax=Bosea sp. BE125 TaxID=2817909 RepID=UPI002855E913|nr:hypothetical protein [Bosea sp. BE125]MDR6870021.1 hypothetical protein [Bosea sp. BE125]